MPREPETCAECPRLTAELEKVREEFAKEKTVFANKQGSLNQQLDDSNNTIGRKVVEIEELKKKVTELEGQNVTLEGLHDLKKLKDFHCQSLNQHPRKHIMQWAHVRISHY